MQRNSASTDPVEFVSNADFDRKYAYKVMSILAGLVMTVMYVEGMLTPSLPSIARDFNVNTAQASLILSLYLVGGVAITPIVGKLGDLFGKKKMLTITLSMYAVAVSITGFSPTFNFMIIARGIQGVGMSVMPLGFALVREEFPKDLVPKAQAIISAMFGAGFAVSLPLGAFVSNNYGWRWTYHSAIPVVVFLVIISYLIIKESRFRRPNVKVDYVGASLLASLLGIFVFAISEGHSWGWTSMGIISLLFSGFVLAVPLVWYERRYTHKGGDAILNFRLLGLRNVLVANIVLTIVGSGMFLSMFALTYRFEEPTGFGKSIFDTGLSMVPFAVGTIIFGPVAGQLVSKTGVKPIAIAGSILAAAGFLLQATLPGYTLMLVYEFITGAGISLLNGTLINFIVLTVHPRDMGIATAMNGTFRSLGSSIGAPVAGSIMASFTIAMTIYLPEIGKRIVYFPSNTAFSLTFIVAGIMFIASALMIPFGREVLGKRQYATQQKRKDQPSTVGIR